MPYYGEGYIRLYRKIGEWRWYDDKPTLILFLHLLITVNWKDEAWHDIMIRRGQRLCSLPILAKETGLSIKSVRTALSHLKETGEVADQSTSKYRIVTVNNFDKYQDGAGKGQARGRQNGIQNGRQTADETAGNNITDFSIVGPNDECENFRVAGKTAGKGQARGRQGAANEEDNNIYTLSKERVGQAPTPKKASMPPTLDEVTAYVGEKGFHVDPARFWNYYESNGWKVGKNPMKNWKAACGTWNLKDKPPNKVLPHDPELDKYDLMYEEKP